MFAKLVAIILSLGLVACVLLTVRHQRLRAVNEMAQISKRVAEADRTLWKLRVEIAARVTPERVQRLASKYGKLVPLTSPKWMGANGPVERSTAAADVPEPLPGISSGPPAADVRPVSLPGPDEDQQ